MHGPYDYRGELITEESFPTIRGSAGRSSEVLDMTGDSDGPFSLSVWRKGANAPIAKQKFVEVDRWSMLLGALGETESLIVKINRAGVNELVLNRISFE